MTDGLVAGPARGAPAPPGHGRRSGDLGHDPESADALLAPLGPPFSHWFRGEALDAMIVSTR